MNKIQVIGVKFGFIFIIIFWIPLAGAAETPSGSMVICEAPRGIAFKTELHKKTKEYEDYYKDTQLIFKLPDKNSNKMGFSFTKNNIGEFKWETAIVVLKKENLISAVKVYPSSIWTFTLFPKYQVGHFSRSLVLFEPQSSLFYSKCKFDN